jgi:PilZ domain
MESNVLWSPSTFNMSGDSIELVDAWSGLLGLKVAGVSERRKRVRTRLHWPLLMFRERPGAENIESVTRDLSSSGFYCLTRVRLAEGEELRCSIKIPTYDPQGKNPERTLECRVRVVRVVPQEATDIFGVACRIEDYHLPLPSATGTP